MTHHAHVGFSITGGFMSLTLSTRMSEREIRTWVLTRYPDASKIRVVIS